MTLQLVACPEWKHVMMVGLKKTLPKKQSKILSSDAICIGFTNNWQFLGNIAHHIFVVQCSVGRASFACVNDWHAADKARGADITTPIQCIVMTCKSTLFTLLWTLVTERPIVTAEKSIWAFPERDKSGFNLQSSMQKLTVEKSTVSLSI